MPFTLIFPLSRYAIARGKQCVCANDPMICVYPGLRQGIAAGLTRNG